MAAIEADPKAGLFLVGSGGSPDEGASLPRLLLFGSACRLGRSTECSNGVIFDTPAVTCPRCCCPAGALPLSTWPGGTPPRPFEGTMLPLGLLWL